MTDESIGRMSPISRWMIFSAAAFVCAGVVLLLLAALEAVDEDVLGQLLATDALALTLVLAAAGAQRAIRAHTLEVAAVLGALAVLAASWVFLYLIWGKFEWPEEELYSSAAWPCMLAGLTFIHTPVLISIRTDVRLLQMLRLVTMGAAWFTAAFVTLLIYAEDLLWGTPYQELLYIIPVLTTPIAIIGTIAYPIAAYSRSVRRKPSVETLESKAALFLACPACGARQSLRAGHARCGTCRRSLFIEIEEPRCECGYLLYRLAGDVCPECGRHVPQHLRGRERVSDDSAGPPPAAASE